MKQMLIKVAATLASLLLIAIISAALLEAALLVLSINVSQEDRSTKQLQSTPDAIRILTLGDSNTYGIFVSEEQSWPAQLQSLLRERGYVVDVVNLGWPGTNSTVINWQFDKALASVKPDLVIVMAGANDGWTTPIYKESITWWQIFQIKSRAYRFFLLGMSSIKQFSTNREIRNSLLLKDPGVSEISKFYEKNNTLFKRDLSIREVSMNGDTMIFGVNTITGNPRYNPKKNGFESTVHYSMDGMLQQSNQRNIPILFLTYPADEILYKSANERILSAAKIISANILDLRLKIISPDLCSEKESSMQCEEYFFPDNHPKEKTYHIIAENIFNFLIENKMLHKRTQKPTEISSE